MVDLSIVVLAKLRRGSANTPSPAEFPSTSPRRANEWVRGSGINIELVQRGVYIYIYSHGYLTSSYFTFGDSSNRYLPFGYD